MNPAERRMSSAIRSPHCPRLLGLASASRSPWVVLLRCCVISACARREESTWPNRCDVRLFNWWTSCDRRSRSPRTAVWICPSRDSITSFFDGEVGGRCRRLGAELLLAHRRHLRECCPHSCIAFGRRLDLERRHRCAQPRDPMLQPARLRLLTACRSSPPRAALPRPPVPPQLRLGSRPPQLLRVEPRRARLPSRPRCRPLPDRSVGER